MKWFKIFRSSIQTAEAVKEKKVIIQEINPDHFAEPMRSCFLPMMNPVLVH